MEQDQKRQELGHSADTGEPLKQPEPADQEAVPRQPGDAEGPFGADMQNLRGGTRPAADNQHPAPAASPYSTGTDADSGASLSAKDPRSSYAARGDAGESGKEANEADSTSPGDGAAP